VDAEPILELAYTRGIPFEQAERAVLATTHDHMPKSGP
jgi:hypothetical protein